MKRFNIDMQQTQHLGHLSSALHTLLPTMKTLQTKHHAYKFQVAITIVCHKAVDPSVATQPPVTLISEMIAVYATDAAPPLDDVNRQLLNVIEVFEMNGSGGYSPISKTLQLTLWQFDPLRGSAFIPQPQWIQARRAVVNVADTGVDCFRWAILAGMHPVDVHADRSGKYIEHIGKYDFSSLSFPILLQSVGPFAPRNNLSINVYGVDPLLFESDGVHHYVTIRLFSRLVARPWTHCCRRCLHAYSSQELLDTCSRLLRCARDQISRGPTLSFHQYPETTDSTVCSIG